MPNPKGIGGFKKGDPKINRTGIRTGRAKVGKSIAEKFRDAMAESLKGDYTKLDSMIDAIMTKALKGDQQAIEYMIARGFGKLIDRIETNNNNKNYDFTNLPMDDRLKLLELLRNANATVPSDNPDSP